VKPVGVEPTTEPHFAGRGFLDRPPEIGSTTREVGRSLSSGRNSKKWHFSPEKVK